MDTNSKGKTKGTECYADDRDSMNDYARYFNNAHLSDIIVKVAKEKFCAHRIVLCKSSEVFDRMLSAQWNKKPSPEIELKEEPQCQKVFSHFLRFLYCNHIVLNGENVLPILMLSDKYAVLGLQKVCIDYTISNVLPELPIRTLIHVWFRYSTSAFHRQLIDECVKKIAENFDQLVGGTEEWEEDWLSLDKDQLTELLKSNHLCLNNEIELWEAVQRWFGAEHYPDRQDKTASKLATQLLPLIRFPLMSAEELDEVENSAIFQKYEKLLRHYLHLAYKYTSMGLISRAFCSEFGGIHFVLRDFKDNRWDKRITIDGEQLKQSINNKGVYSVNFATKASTYPRTHWEWELGIMVTHPTSSYLGGVKSPEELAIELHAVDMDQQRAVEFMLTITDEKEVLRTFTGRNTFTKSRPICSIKLDNRMQLNELIGTEPTLLHNNKLHLQLMLRPIV